MKFINPCNKCLVKPACGVSCKEFIEYRKLYPLMSTVITVVGILIYSIFLGSVMQYLTKYIPYKTLYNSIIIIIFSLVGSIAGVLYTLRSGKKIKLLWQKEKITKEEC